MTPIRLESPPRSETDAALIERSWREPERFADVFDRHYGELHGFVSRRLGPSLADDLASETFLIAFDRRQRHDVAYPDAGPWLYGIAANLISRHHRVGEAGQHGDRGTRQRGDRRPAGSARP